MKWTKENREKLQYASAFLLLITGIGLIIVDFFAPVLGEIHNTSLYLLGECLTFCGAVFGISAHYQSELDNFKNEIRQSIGKE